MSLGTHGSQISGVEFCNSQAHAESQWVEDEFCINDACTLRISLISGALIDMERANAKARSAVKGRPEADHLVSTYSCIALLKTPFRYAAGS